MLNAFHRKSEGSLKSLKEFEKFFKLGFQSLSIYILYIYIIIYICICIQFEGLRGGLCEKRIRV